MNKRSIMKHEHKMHHAIIPSHPVHLDLTPKRYFFSYTYLELEGDFRKLDIHT